MVRALATTGVTTPAGRGGNPAGTVTTMERDGRVVRGVIGGVIRGVVSFVARRRITDGIGSRILAATRGGLGGVVGVGGGRGAALGLGATALQLTHEIVEQVAHQGRV
jgi:hypothetical protein